MWMFPKESAANFTKIFCENNRTLVEILRYIFAVIRTQLAIAWIKSDPKHSSWRGNTFRITGPLWRESICHQWILLIKDQWCRALMFILMLTWKNCWTNNTVAEDLRFHDFHDIFVMLRHHSLYPCFYFIVASLQCVIMNTMASQITGVSIVCSTIWSGAENIKALLHWPLWGESTDDQWIPLTKHQ